MIQGGIRVTDPSHYPWFAFLKIALPDVEMIIYDPETFTYRYFQSYVRVKMWGKPHQIQILLVSDIVISGVHIPQAHFDSDLIYFSIL